MTNERAHDWAQEVRREGNHSLQRAVMFAAVLIFVHLLELRPTQVEAFNIKVGLPDPSILRGALAIVFYSKFYDACGNLYSANAYSKLHSERWFARSIIQRSKKKNRSPSNVKRVARLKAFGGVLFMMPYVVGLLVVLGLALLIGIIDMWDLADYAWNYGASAQVERYIGV